MRCVELSRFWRTLRKAASAHVDLHFHTFLATSTSRNIRLPWVCIQAEKLFQDILALEGPAGLWKGNRYAFVGICGVNIVVHRLRLGTKKKENHRDRKLALNKLDELELEVAPDEDASKKSNRSLIQLDLVSSICTL